MEPFEVMISESQERMCAAVLPERWDDGPRGLRALGPAGGGHRPGHDRRRHRDRERRLDADGRPRPERRTGAHAGRGPDQRRDRASSGSRRPRPTGAPRPPRVAPIASATACRSAGWIRARSCWHCSARPTSRHAMRSSSSTTRPSAADTSPDPGRGAAVLRVKGTTKALVATTDGNQAIGALDPWLGAA